MTTYQMFLGVLSFVGAWLAYRGYMKMYHQEKQPLPELKEGEAPSIWIPGLFSLSGGVILLTGAGSMLSESIFTS